MTALLDHLWQSSLFALAMGLLTLALRRNEARIRFWLWFAASLKFLLPFALLSMMGQQMARLAPASSIPPAVKALAPAAEKFSTPVQTLAAPPAPYFAQLLILVWLLGFGLMMAVRLARWLKLRALVRQAQALPLCAPIAVKTSQSLLEPGLVGIVRPVVLLPQGLLATLSLAERDGILAHEVTHFRRRDNLTAALHMLVEALFWFWPPVWLIGGRLIAERERACDEGVIAAGHDPEVYAGGILKVCRFCIRSPLACASGASGADLHQRIRQIMSGEEVASLNGGRRALLAGAGLLALALPVMGGLIAVPLATMPLAVSVARQVVAVQARAEQAVGNAAEQFGLVPVTIPVVSAALPRFQIAAAAASVPPPAAPAETSASPIVPTEAPAPVPAPPVATDASAPVREASVMLDPRGEGDPDAVTCRVPQILPGSRLAGPQVCQTNRVWAALYKEGRRLEPDGHTMVAANVLYGRPSTLCPPALVFAAPPGAGTNNPILAACR